MTTEDTFYSKAAKYWQNIPPTIDGMLGGLAHVSSDDVRGSRLFLDQILSAEDPPQIERALDCGAGIGRVSKYLLMPIFGKVDLVEQNALFLEKVPEYCEEFQDRIGTLYPVGLQSFTPDKKYDVIWSQWVLGHLNDEHLVDFLVKCREALNPNGVIVVKENVTSSGNVELDEEDSSVTRPHKVLTDIFKRAKLKRIKESRQLNFPSELYPVYIFAMKPKTLNNQAN